MSHDPERRDADSRTEFARRFEQLTTVLLGPDDNPELGFVHRTTESLTKLDTKVDAEFEKDRKRIRRLEKFALSLLAGGAVLYYIADKAWAVIAK